VLEAIASICGRARAAGLSVGMGPDVEYATRVARVGVHSMQCGGDCGFMIRAADAVYQSIRSRLKEATPAKPGR
jgi:hypothetical protein